MNGKMTVKRRQERVGHRLRADLRTSGLVRPGAAVETRTEALRYRGVKCARNSAQIWVVPRKARLSSQAWDEGRFFMV